MFLKKIQLFGFKSFADRVSLDFSDGITSLLGPNGCGKSNIVDSIKWVLGEQSFKTLRAGQMEDVIFNGTESRKPLNVAEVVLTIANDSGMLSIDLPEIELRRRIYRGGENEYAINNTPVRLKDVRELFYDTGIGKSAYSILEQGKIDQILSHRPEDRRYIFEEAAGITRFKKKSGEAVRKLQKTDENIMQVENILREVRKTYESRKIQAQKAEQYRKLQEEVFQLEVEVQLSKVKELMDQYSQKMEAIDLLEKEYREIKESIDAANREMEDTLDEINALSRDRIDTQTRVHRLDESRNSKESQISLLQDRISDFEKSVHEAEERGSSLKSRIDRDSEEISQKELARRELLSENEIIDREIRTFQDNMFTAETRIEENIELIHTHELRIEQEREKQERMREELKELTDVIVSQLERKLEESGYSAKERQAVEQELDESVEKVRLSLKGKVAITADFLGTGSGKKQEQYLKELHSSLQAVIRDYDRLAELIQQYKSVIPVFLDEFLAPEGIITQKQESNDSLEHSLELVKNLTAEIRSLREENEHLQKKMGEYRQTLENLKLSQADMKGRADSLQALIENLRRSVQEQELLLEDSNSDIQVSLDRIEETKVRIALTRKELEDVDVEIHELQERLHQVIAEIELLNEQVKERREAVNTKYTKLSTYSKAIEKLRAEREAVEHEIKFVFDAFEDTYSKSLKEFDSKMFEIRDDIAQLRTRLRSSKQELQGLGYINHMAGEEFKEVKERYEFLTRQLDDLERAKNDLTEIYEEITRKSEEMFAQTYEKLKVNFHSMFRRLFGGGRAELKLVDPDDILNSGIDILAQPPGKKLEKISLLSGGERSLTAVALLFATYMVKPSPFCILDEIDAALDDANIGHFLDVLHEFSVSSQFIIITHNKKTVLGSKTLLGVTMEEPGISKAVSYRIQDMENDPSTHLIG